MCSLRETCTTSKSFSVNLCTKFSLPIMILEEVEDAALTSPHSMSPRAQSEVQRCIVPFCTVHTPMAARTATGIALRGVTSLASRVQRPAICRSALQSRRRCVHYQHIAAALAVCGTPFVRPAIAQDTCRSFSGSFRCAASATMEAPNQASPADNPLLQVLCCTLTIFIQPESRNVQCRMSLPARVADEQRQMWSMMARWQL